ncbi:MAG TPA: acylphosphatase [Phycisphaerae bacterium]|nr:acylphosphatase [Phycisphaerae bacterium]
MKQQRIVYFSGTVQGVGFRFTACRAAAGFDVTGCVRNLPDGRVHCLIEGQGDQIDAFLEELERRMRGYIRHTTQQTAPPSGRWESFDVAY